jgi:hypothetical protein
MEAVIDTIPQEEATLQKVTALDVLETEIFKHPQVHCPLVHRFTPGLYIREIFMPAGSLITSARHLTCHPFVVSKGDVSVYVEGVEVDRYKAPYTGITHPGTRRLLYIHEDTVWTTFHVTDKTDPDEIVMEIADVEPNPLLTKEDYEKSGWRAVKSETLEEETTCL